MGEGAIRAPVVMAGGGSEDKSETGSRFPFVALLPGEEGTADLAAACDTLKSSLRLVVVGSMEVGPGLTAIQSICEFFSLIRLLCSLLCFAFSIVLSS